MQEELPMNLQAAGIVAEYNPFHNGHMWQIQSLKNKIKNTPVIVCMGGYFMQRGEPALTGPLTRAAMAVRSGADLVLLLPTWYSLHSADYFAAGAVKTLAATGIVNALACSTEKKGTPASLEATATWALEKNTEKKIRFLLQKGLSYGAAWETAAADDGKDAGWFNGANNILALAYQKTLLQSRHFMELLVFPRQGSGYNDTEMTPPYTSASSIRQSLKSGAPQSVYSSVMPDSALSLLNIDNTNYPACLARQEKIITTLLAHLLSLESSLPIFEHTSASRDLCKRFYNKRKELKYGFESFCKNVGNKRDPQPAVQRLSLQLLLQRPRAFWTEFPEPSYLHVLAFNNRGRSLLKQMKQTAKLPIIIKPGNEEQYRNTTMYPLLHLDSEAADLFQLLKGNVGSYGTEFTGSPVYINE